MFVLSDNSKKNADQNTISVEISVQISFLTIPPLVLCEITFIVCSFFCLLHQTHRMMMKENGKKNEKKKKRTASDKQQS